MIHRSLTPFVRLAAVAALLVPLAGFTQCGPDEVPIGRNDSGTMTGGDAGHACTASSDCASGETCGFPVADHCSATGVCIHDPSQDPGPHPASARIECACNGTVLSFASDYPNGYAPAPVRVPSDDPSAICGPTVSQDGGVPSSCTSSDQCAAGETCGFAVSQACAATGVCIHDPSQDTGVAHCQSIRIACGCDGHEITTACDYPAGYAPRPVSPGDPSSCGGGAVGSCTSDAQCGVGETCGFPVAQMCTAVGTCMYNPAADPTLAHCQSIREACGCDGSRVNVACDYPSGYAPRPVQSVTSCQ